MGRTFDDDLLLIALVRLKYRDRMGSDRDRITARAGQHQLVKDLDRDALLRLVDDFADAHAALLYQSGADVEAYLDGMQATIVRRAAEGGGQ